MNSTEHVGLIPILGAVALASIFAGVALLLQSNRAWETIGEAVGIHREKSVVLFGDSLMAQINMALNFGWSPYKNRSVSGRRAVDAFSDLEKTLPVATDFVFLLGTNDLGTGIPPEELVLSLERLGQASKAAGCGVVVCSILPVSGTHLSTRSPKVLACANGMVHQMCIRNEFAFLDVHALFTDKHGLLDSRYSEDGLHLNWKGRSLLSAVLKKANFSRGSETGSSK